MKSLLIAPIQFFFFLFENQREDRHGYEQKTLKARVREAGDGDGKAEPSCRIGRWVLHKAMAEQTKAWKCDSEEEEVSEENGV